MRFLRQIFPDARFIHVVRDGRAIVHSLLNVAFWVERGGLDEPWWLGGLTEEDMAGWQRSGSDPAVWRLCNGEQSCAKRVLKPLDLPDGTYTELSYEDFVVRPHEEIARLYE